MNYCGKIALLLNGLAVVIASAFAVSGCSSSLDVAIVHAGAPVVDGDDEDTVDTVIHYEGTDEDVVVTGPVCGTCGRNEVACTPEISLAMPVGDGEDLCAPWLWLYGDVPDGVDSCLRSAHSCADVSICLDDKSENAVK